MSIRNLLVPLSGATTDQGTLETAVLVAQRFDGHLDAIHVRVDPLRQLPIADETMSPTRLHDLENIEKANEQRSNAARANFDDCLAANGIQLCEEPPAAESPSASWYLATGIEAEEVAQRGGAYDLIVLDQTLARSRDSSRETLKGVLFGTGRPALLAPPERPKSIGDTVMVGWNRTAQSARSIVGAMPFLQGAKRVIVFMVATGAKQGPSPDDLARTLAWHDIKTEVREITPDGRPVGQAVLDEATAVKADLLVMGAYSHSRWREMILGGVTRFVIEHAELPVFLAH